MIKPTVGRVVWFRHFKGDPGFAKNDTDQPLAAIVAYVWADDMVNLVVFDHNGVSWPRTSVKLVQDDIRPENRPAPGDEFAEWMPYQIGQAKKHEGSDASVDPRRAPDGPLSEDTKPGFKPSGDPGPLETGNKGAIAPPNDKGEDKSDKAAGTKSK